MTPENIIERVIVRQIVRDGLRLGYTITVNDGEEDAIVRSADEAAIMAACFSTDEDRISIRGKDGASKGWVRLVYGNGTSVISDYSDVPAAVGWLVDAEALVQGIEDGTIELAPSQPAAPPKPAKVYVVVTKSDGGPLTVKVLDEGSDRDTQMAAFGDCRPTGKVGGDHLRVELRGEPSYTNLIGPMWGGIAEDMLDGRIGDRRPIVRYETQEAYDRLSR